MKRAGLVGRVWRPNLGDPSVVLLRSGSANRITPSAPGMADLLEGDAMVFNGFAPMTRRVKLSPAKGAGMVRYGAGEVADHAAAMALFLSRQLDTGICGGVGSIAEARPPAALQKPDLRAKHREPHVAAVGSRRGRRLPGPGMGGSLSSFLIRLSPERESTPRRGRPECPSPLATARGRSGERSKDCAS